jgi:hypothetical protein
VSGRTKRALAILGAVFLAVALAGTGAYVLRQYQTFAGLMTGAGLILLALAVAFPTPFHEGVVVLKTNLVLIVPVIADALKGGSRKSDPPADPPTKEGQ